MVNTLMKDTWTHWHITSPLSWKWLQHMASWMFHIIFIQVVYQSWVIIVPNKTKILIIILLIDFNSLVVAITRSTWTYRLMWTDLTVLVNHKSFQQIASTSFFAKHSTMYKLHYYMVWNISTPTVLHKSQWWSRWENYFLCYCLVLNS